MKALLTLLAVVGLLAARPATAQDAPATTTNQITTRSLVEAALLLERIPNPAVQAYLQKRLEALLAIEAPAERAESFARYLAELREAVSQIPVAVSNRPMPAMEPPAGAVPIPPAMVTNNAVELELLDLLTKYGCLLYDLEDRGFLPVRNELVDNVLTTGLSFETVTLLRQLVLLCDEAERALQSTREVQEEIADAMRILYLQNLGVYSASTLMSGDPLALIQGVVAVARGHLKLAKERGRRLQAELQNHRGRLANFLFAVNVRRTELQTEPQRGLTKEVYDQFRGALLERDPQVRLGRLRQCQAMCPGFREVLYYLAATHHELGQYGPAEELLQELTRRPSAVLRRDGLVAAAHDILAYYRLRAGDPSNAVAQATLALQQQPARATAYDHRAQAWLLLGDTAAAFANVTQALRLMPAHGDFYWTATRVAARYSLDPDVPLAFLHLAVQRGFTNFPAVRACGPLQPALATPRGRALVRPPVMAQYNAGLLNDDIALTNLAPYALTGLRVTVRLEYVQGSQTVREIVRQGHVAALPPGGQSVFTSVRSMPGHLRCVLRLSYECNQHTGVVFQTVSCHNYLRRGVTGWYHVYLHREAQNALRRRDPAAYPEACRQAEEAAALTLRQDADILETWRCLAAELGRTEVVERLRQERAALLRFAELTAPGNLELLLARCAAALNAGVSIPAATNPRDSFKLQHEQP